MVSSFNSSNVNFASLIGNVHTKNPLLRTAIGATESLTGTTISSRTKDKFSQGWLGGVGSTSQFQSVNSTIPVMPNRNNNDLEARMVSSSGVITGERLLPSWERSYAFAPGRGVSALHSRITHTDANAGQDTLTGVVAPLVNAGIDRTGDGPAPPLRTYQGLGAMTQAPVVVTGGEAADATVSALAQAFNAAKYSHVTARGRSNAAAPPPSQPSSSTGAAPSTQKKQQPAMAY